MAKDINDLYECLIDPMEFVKNFKSDSEFIDWLKLGSEEDLECTLVAFERMGMYEYCSIIKNYIQCLKD